MPGSTNPPFQVSYPGAVRAALKDLCVRAAAKGRLDEVLAAARLIDNRLHADPRDFGEQRYPLRHMKLEVYVAAAAPLIVFYAVHQALPVVFVREIEPLPGETL